MAQIEKQNPQEPTSSTGGRRPLTAIIPVKNFTGDRDAHYDIDGVSYAAGEVVVSGDHSHDEACRRQSCDHEKPPINDVPVEDVKLELFELSEEQKASDD